MPKVAQQRLAILHAMTRGPMVDPFTGPNLERMSADPHVCFIGDDGGDGGTGGEPPPAPEPKYTDADMQRAVATRLSKEQKKFSTELDAANTRAAEADALREQLAKFQEEAEMAGKTAVEKEQARFQKQMEKQARETEDLRKALAERDAAVTATTQTLRTERATRQVLDTLGSEKALNASRAAKYAMTDIVVTHGDDGSMTATYGDVEGSVSDAVKAWLKDNDNFLPAQAGGAGTPTRVVGGRSNKSYADMSMDEIASMVDATDPLKRR